MYLNGKMLSKHAHVLGFQFLLSQQPVAQILKVGHSDALGVESILGLLSSRLTWATNLTNLF